MNAQETLKYYGIENKEEFGMGLLKSFRFNCDTMNLEHIINGNWYRTNDTRRFMAGKLKIIKEC